MLALKDLMEGLGLAATWTAGRTAPDRSGGARAGYLFNTTIAGIEEADALLLIGTNPRWEAAMVNARLRKRFLMGGFKVGVIGEQVDLTYRPTTWAPGPETLKEAAEGRGAGSPSVLDKAEKPMLILGMGALARPDGAACWPLARQVAERSAW